jgi:hypothetical protein
MSRLLVSTLFPPVLLCGCGGSGDGPGGGVDDGGLADLSRCTADSFALLAYLSDGFEALIDEINSIDRPEVSVWNSATGAYVFEADLTNNGFNETTVSGQVSAVNGSFADGLDVGDEIAATWNLLAGGINGNGMLGFEELANDQRALTGSGSFVLLNGCVANFSNVDLTFSTPSSGPPDGSFDFVIDLDGGTLTGTVTVDGTRFANVSATLNGVPVNFQIDTNDFSLVP